MKKHLRIAWVLLRCRVSRQMVYRLSFWTAFFVDMTYFLLQLLTFSTIFRQIDTIGGWGLPHMAIFLGTFTMLDAVYMCTYFFGVIGIPEKIRTGALDLYLTRPVSALYLLSIEGLDFGSILVTLPGLLMVAWGVRASGILITPLLVAGYLVLFVMMYLLMYCVMILLRAPAFWLLRVNAFGELEGALVEFAFRVPGTVYRGIWKMILYIALPYGLMATLPTQFLTGEMHWRHWLLAGGVLAGFWILTTWVWKTGLRRYGSASS
ncbi:MAG TPA: ABC-2 family transporter protein [Anaerolineaceae bacterium]